MNGKYECNTRRLSVGVEMKFETGKELPLTSRSNMIENEASSIAKAKATRKVRNYCALLK